MALCAVFTFFILKKTRILFSLFCWRKTRSWSPHFIGEVSLISVIQSAISSSTCILQHFLSFWFEIFLWPTHITTLCNEHWLDHISLYLTYIYICAALLHGFLISKFPQKVEILLMPLTSLKFSSILVLSSC